MDAVDIIANTAGVSGVVVEAAVVVVEAIISVVVVKVRKQAAFKKNAELAFLLNKMVPILPVNCSKILMTTS